MVVAIGIRIPAMVDTLQPNEERGDKQGAYPSGITKLLDVISCHILFHRSIQIALVQLNFYCRIHTDV